MTSAIQEWESRIPQLDFSYLPGGGPWSAYLYFKPGSCDNIPNFISCWRLVTYQGPDNDRLAEYWYRGWIEIINPADPAWSSPGRKDAYQHELGHYIGLHHESTCTTLDTIMNVGDRALGVLRLNGQGQCASGSHTPSQADVGNAKTFWLAKTYNGAWDADAHIKNVVASKRIEPNQDRILRGKWEDCAWGEYWHYAWVIYWDWPTQNWSQPLAATWPIKCLGFQKTVSGRDYSVFDQCLNQEWNVTQQQWPLGRYYYVGVASWINPERILTPTQWSAPIWVD